MNGSLRDDLVKLIPFQSLYCLAPLETLETLWTVITAVTMNDKVLFTHPSSSFLV